MTVTAATETHEPSYTLDRITTGVGTVSTEARWTCSCGEYIEESVPTLGMARRIFAGHVEAVARIAAMPRTPLANSARITGLLVAAMVAAR